MDSIDQENSPTTDCKRNTSNVPDQNDDQSNKNGFQLIGEHENQVSQGGEGDLHKHKNNCKKNPGHKDFIPIESITLEHLPEGHHDIDLYNLIKAAADLTVRLSVTMTSPHRPDFWPNTEIPYFLSDMRGTKTYRAATGWVGRVKKYTDEDKQTNYKTCSCDTCKSSDKPNKVWWQISVFTAAHVAFDDIEASHTTLRLFYDRDDSPLVILKDKVQVGYVVIEQDLCKLTCVTCNENVGNRLMKAWEGFKDIWGKVESKYKTSRDADKFNFIVSHPHGCSKQVSVGQWKDMVRVGVKYDYKFTYTTCTCHGSSGAFVHCVGYSADSFFNLVHSGCLKSGLNHSGGGNVMY